MACAVSGSGSLGYGYSDGLSQVAVKTSNWPLIYSTYFAETDTLVVEYIHETPGLVQDTDMGAYPGLYINYTAAGKIVSIEVRSASQFIKFDPKAKVNTAGGLTISQMYDPYEDKISVFFTACPVKPVMEKKTDDDRVRVLLMAEGTLVGLVIDKASAEVASEE